MNTNKKIAKDHEHARREVYNPLCADVLVDANTNFMQNANSSIL